MAYPTARPLKIKIDGNDRTNSISVVPDDIGSRGIYIQDYLPLSMCFFTVKNGGGMSLDERQEVLVTNVAESVKYFGGYIVKLHSRQRGPFLDFDVDVEDYSFLLKNSESPISKTYTDQSDQAIIRDALITCAPDVETVTYVEQLDASIAYIKFDGKSGWEVLEEISQKTGGLWYVDYGKKLHYFDAGTNAAPYALSDVVADPPVGPYPYDDLEKVVETPEADKVVTQGKAGWYTARFKATSQDSEQGNLSYENVGGIKDGFVDDAQDFSDWETGAGALVTDGSFEQTDSQWNNGDLNNWTKDNAEDDKEVGDPGAGATSVKITTSAANGGIYQGSISVTAGSDYRLMFIYKNTAGDVAQYRIYDEDNAADIVAYTDLADSTSWGAPGTINFTAPAGCSNVRVYLAGKANGDIVWFDSVSVVLFTGAAYLIVIENSELGSSWGYLGTTYTDNTKIYVYNDRLLTDPGFNNQWPGSMTPTSYHVYPARGDKGYWITAKIVDTDLITTQQTDERGDQFLDSVADTSGYTCTVKEPGLRTGMDIDATNAVFGLSADSFLIKSVVTRWIGENASLEAALELGLHHPFVSDVLVKGRQIWDETQFVPVNPGILEMISGDLDGQVEQYLDTYNDQLDYPSKTVHRKSHTDTLEDLTPTLDTEELGLWEIYGVESGGDWQLAAFMKLIQDGAAGAGNIDALWQLDSPLCLMSQQELRFYDDGNYVGFKAPALAADQIWALPDADGNANEVLTTDGAGNLSWGAGGGEGISPNYEDLILETYSTTEADTSEITFRKSDHDTFGTLAQTDQNDVLGLIEFRGVNTTPAWALGAFIKAHQGAAAGSFIPTVLTLKAYKDNGSASYIEIMWANLVVKADTDLDLSTDTGDIYLNAANSGQNIYLDADNVIVTVATWMQVNSDLDVVGTLTKGAGAFRIDHPLRPDTHWLYHSMVESPDMMNIYNGNTQLDKNGMAWVKLPEYFEALNRNYRYQLTPIGKAMTMLHVANEIDGNCFLIAGGRANGLVSWQVTGIRQDRFANENRIQVEVRKTDD